MTVLLEDGKLYTAEQVEQVVARGAFAHGHEYGVGSRNGAEYEIGS